MDRLRITIVQGAFLPVPPLLGGAVEKAWYALGREFARLGHQVTHVGRSHPELPEECIDAGVHYRRVRGHATPRALWKLKLLDLAYSRRARRMLPPADILVTNTFWMPVLERRRSRGRPYVHVARYPKGQLRFYPRRAILQTVSEPIRAAILREVPDGAARVRVIAYPLAPAYLVPRQPAEPVILYAGRLHPEKGVHLLVEAFARRAQSTLRGWSLRVVGPWTTAQGGGGEAYRARLLELGRTANGCVQIVDPIFDEAQLVAEYRRAAIFAYPSLAEFGETFGLAVLEAMAAGCAPVVSALGCFGDFLRDGVNGWVFDHRQADASDRLGRSLEELARDSSLREELRTAAWETARNYALPQIALRFLEDFRAVMERPTGIRSHTAACLPHQT